MILPHFHYCSMVWENYGNCLLDKLQKMQNRAATSEILKELDLQTLENRVIKLYIHV